MANRTRTRSGYYPVPSRYRQSFNATANWNDESGIYPTNLDQTCVDTVGNWTADNPLSITLRDDRGLELFNGSAGTEGSGWFIECQNSKPVWAGSLVTHIDHPNAPSLNEVAVATLAGTNPSKPYISIPNFIYELKDLPGMLRDIGHLKLQAGRLFRRRSVGPGGIGKASANHYLAAQMGWAPLISDLRKLLDFQSRVDKKVNELDRLFNKNGGLQRTFGKPNTRLGKTGKWHFVDTTQAVLTHTAYNGSVGFLTARRDSITTSDYWGSVRWTATKLPSHRYSNAELQSMARRIVFGANLTPKVIWEAIPWSWLVDWFTNVGTYLDATTNVIPVRASTPCVMVHRHTVRSIGPRTDSRRLQIRGGTGTMIYETKTRSIQSPTLSATLPFLSKRQLSILGALAIQRLR